MRKTQPPGRSPLPPRRKTQAPVDYWFLTPFLSSLEECFHDVKEVWGAGQQQVRSVWSNMGCWHLNQWLFTLVELCSWDQEKSTLVDRRDRPWDNATRRPSHADRRRAMARQMLRKQFPATPPADHEAQKLHTLAETLLSLCT